jgi:hypothetical protein
LARLTLQAVPNIYDFVLERSFNDETVLHIAMKKFWHAKKNAIFGGKEHFLDLIEPIISNVLAAGTDVHASD